MAVCRVISSTHTCWLAAKNAGRELVDRGWSWEVYVWTLIPRVSRLSPPTPLPFFVCYKPTMGKNKTLSTKTIAQIIGLHKAGHPTREIVATTGASERSVRNWVRRSRDGGGEEMVYHKPRPWREKKHPHVL